MLTAMVLSQPAPAQTVQGVTDKEILIAAFGPLTGPASWIGLGTRDGFTLGIEEINKAGGIHGRQIRLVYEDEAYQVAQAQTVVRRILAATKPFMIYAGTGSTVFISVADTLREAGIPVYSGFSGSAEVRKSPEAPNLFHGQAVSSATFVSDLATLLSDLKVQRLAVMFDVGEWGRSLCQPTVELMKKRGLAPLTVQNYKVGDTDFSGQLVAIRNANAQVVINCGHFPEASVILRQARELGIKSLFIGDAAQANPSVWARAGKATDNWIFNWFSPAFLSDETGPMVEFRAKYKARYPSAPAGRPNHADTFSYGDAYIIAKALRDAGPNLTPQGFNAAMKKIKDFQPSPINAVANFDNPGNDGFAKTVWVLVNDGKTVVMGPSQVADIAKIISGL
jgi:branched-chain amino acid transport system substrate-binding protein